MDELGKEGKMDANVEYIFRLGTGGICMFLCGNQTGEGWFLTGRNVEPSHREQPTRSVQAICLAPQTHIRVGKVSLRKSVTNIQAQIYR